MILSSFQKQPLSDQHIQKITVIQLQSLDIAQFCCFGAPRSKHFLTHRVSVSKFQHLKTLYINWVITEKLIHTYCKKKKKKLRLQKDRNVRKVSLFPFSLTSSPQFTCPAIAACQDLVDLSRIILCICRHKTSVYMFVYTHRYF